MVPFGGDATAGDRCGICNEWKVGSEARVGNRASENTPLEHVTRRLKCSCLHLANEDFSYLAESRVKKEGPLTRPIFFSVKLNFPETKFSLPLRQAGIKVRLGLDTRPLNQLQHTELL